MAEGATRWRTWPERSPLRRDVLLSYHTVIPARSGSFELPVVPDGHVDLLWGPAGNLRVAGPDTRFRTVDLPPGDVLGVRFRTGCAAPYLGQPISTVTDTRVALAELWGADAERLAERLEMAGTGAQALRLMRAELLVRLPAAPSPDPLVLAAIAAIRHDLRRRVADLGMALGVSDRQFRRRFVASMGYAPKTFQRVIRIQRFWAMATGPAPSLSLADLAQAVGFVDQAHLSNECLKLTRMTPTSLLHGCRPSALDPRRTQACPVFTRP